MTDMHLVKMCNSQKHNYALILKPSLMMNDVFNKRVTFPPAGKPFTVQSPAVTGVTSVRVIHLSQVSKTKKQKKKPSKLLQLHRRSGVEDPK